MPNEFEYIAWLRAQTPTDARVRIGPGDDCAALAPPARELLITTDMLMDGTDFILSEVDPRRVGRKAMAVNLSDIAAMAGVPIAAVVSVALPRPTPPSPLPEGKGEKELSADVASNPAISRASSPFPDRRGLQGEPVGGSPSQGARGDGGGGSLDGPFSSEGIRLPEQLYLGLRDVADAFGVPIVGGDTNTWANKLVISVTALGEATARGSVRRSGAKPGDWLFVTGPLGGSILGHHLDFTPRVREALLLHETVELRAMLDISDGLTADLNHICEESKCGAVVVAEAIPISDAARELSRTSGKKPLQHALGDGEDFELVFAVSPTDGAKLLRQPPVPGLTKIGECIETGLWIEENGARKPLAPTGWVHAL